METVLDQASSAQTLNTASPRVKRVVLLSLGLTVALALVEYLLYRYTGSLAVKADAYHSGSDVFAGLLVLINCSRIFRSRDWCRVGSGLGIAALIVFSAVKVGYEACQEIQAAPRHLGLAILVTLGAMVMAYLVAQYKIRIGHAEHFPLLVMEGQHTLADALSSGVVLIGILGQKTGIRLDAACALVIAILIFRMAVEVMRAILRDAGWQRYVSAYRLSWRRSFLLGAGFSLIYAFSGVYQVAEGDVGVIERFGKFIRCDAPGLRYHLPAPFEVVRRVNTGAVQRFDIGARQTPQFDVEEGVAPTSTPVAPVAEVSDSSGSPSGDASANSPALVSSAASTTAASSVDPVANFLHETAPAGSSGQISAESSAEASAELFRFSGDQALLLVGLGVSYRIVDPVSYLYRSDDVQAVLRAVCEAALTSAFARTAQDDLLGQNRAAVLQQMLTAMNAKIASLQLGIEVLHLAYLNLEPPAQVVPAFRMASSAREDRERYINEAETYAERIAANGRAESAEILRQADADAAWLLATTQAETTGIERLFAVADSHPQAMRQNLYLDAVERVLRANPHILFSETGTPLVLDVRPQKEE